MNTPRSDRGKTRAELARERRSRESQQHSQQAATRVRYTAVTPPLTMRGSMGTPVIQRTRSQVRRQVNIRLGSPGAEMQLPSLPAIRPGWRLVSGLLVILCCAAVIMGFTAPTFQVGVPEVAGLTRISAEDLSETLRLENTPVFLVQPSQVQARVARAYPELKDISVKVILPNRVIVSAVERQPILAWEYDTNLIWIDAEGLIFPARGEPAAPLLTIVADSAPPLFTPVDSLAALVEDPTATPEEQAAEKPANKPRVPKQVSPEFLKAIFALSEKLPPETSLTYNSSNGLGWNDPLGWKVYVGVSLEDFDLKLALYERIVKALQEKGIQPALVSVAYLHAPFYRLEE